MLPPPQLENLVRKVVTQDQDMKGRRILNLGDAQDPGDAISKQELDDAIAAIKKAIDDGLLDVVVSSLYMAGIIRVGHNKSSIGFYGATPTPLNPLIIYAPNIQNVAYNGINNAQAGSVYAQLVDLNTLRVAYENLRQSYEDLRGKLHKTGLV